MYIFIIIHGNMIFGKHSIIIAIGFFFVELK